MTDATTPLAARRSRLLRGSGASLGPILGQEFPDPHPPSIGRGAGGASRGPAPKFTNQKRHYE